MQKSLLFAAVATASLLAHTAAAEEYVTLSAGAFDVDDASHANFGLEYRGESFWYDLLPVVGIQSDVEGDSYGYFGFNYDWQFANNWYLAPTAAVGVYNEGAGVDLGGPIQFRTGLEVSYRMDNAHRLGLAVHHLSNAGIYDQNPGTEQVMLSYSVPVNLFK